MFALSSYHRRCARPLLPILSYHTTAWRLQIITDEQHKLLQSLNRRDLPRLAKMHNVRGNQTSVALVEQLSVILASSTLSAHSTKWVPKENTTALGDGGDVESEGDEVNSSASAWLAPDEVDPTNRRVMKSTRSQGHSHHSPGLEFVARRENKEDTEDEELMDGDGTLVDITGALDPDAEWYEAIQRSDSNISEGGRKGLEVHWNNNDTPTSTLIISEGVPLSVEQIVHILADNNARDIHQYDQIRMDAEHYVIATGLSLRHVRSLKDALVHAAKKTKVPGLSSSSIATSGRKSPLAHWEVIDLRETMVHLMTGQGRELYDLEGLWKHGVTQKDMEDGF